MEPAARPGQGGSRVTPQDVRRLIEERGIRTVRVVFNDNTNVARARNIPAEAFLEDVIEHGVQYPSAMLSVDTSANFVLEAGGGWAGGYGSWLLRPDLETFTILPWAPGTARVIADLYDLDGNPVEIAPRRILSRVVEELRREGFTARAACEFEFYVFRRLAPDGYEPSWTGLNCYAEVKQAQVDDILNAISVGLNAIGLGIEAANTEYGPGQFEISMKHQPAVRAADHAMYYKTSVKELMQQKGYLATFMTKPLTGRSGSGSHLHHSLYRLDGTNAFYDPDAPDGLSDIARHFIAGELAHARAICALANPTINSYKRLRPYTFAPANVSWGYENRMCMIRVPKARGQGTHLENRLPGADNNAYHLLAAVLAAGLDGIRRKLEPPAPVVDRDAYADASLPPLPQSLEEALDALNRDEVLVEMLGADFVRSYTALKNSELRRFRDHVTDWEVNEYAELF
ncbi:MAG: glutamine synthetase [Firmicutes bacterium]|nr:glutamine synthetase [Bacillota bacterium]